MCLKSNILNEKGIVMVAAIVFILAIMTFGFFFILMIQTEVEEEIVTEEFKNALYCAESGFARATWLLQHDPQWRDASLSNSTCTVDIQGTITEGATYTIYLSWISQQGTPTSPPGPNEPEPGEVLWRYELPGGGVGSYPYDVQYLNNGHILITEMHGDRRIFELIPDFEHGGGQIVWVYDNNQKMTCAKRMANGHTLVVEPHSYKGWVYEITNDGTKVWEWKAKDYPDYVHRNSWMQDADELPDGNILITMRKAISKYEGLVVIVDYTTGSITWSYEANQPTDADYLSNGNILITEKSIQGTDIGRIIEVDYHTKQIVWEVGGLDNPYDADRLPNGNTVICESGGYDYWDPDNQGRISEVDPTGQETLDSPLVTGLARPHAVAIVPRANGDIDVLVANTGSSGGGGNEILLIKGWSSQIIGNRVSIVSIGDYLGCKNTVMVEADIDTNTGVLSNISWKEEKGVPLEYR